MELSLQSKINYKNLSVRRKEMITAENLHIQDAINREAFFYLYEKYGKDMSEKDFARYFLDIDYTSYYRLQSKMRDTAIVLTREFYLDEELDEMRKRLLEETGIQPKSQINNEKLLELYRKYGGKFSLKMFAEEALALNAHRVDDLNFKPNSTAIVLNREFPNRTVIRKVRENIVKSETKLHMSSKITLSEFENLYKKYVILQGFELDKKNFALKVLGITNDTYLRFENGKRESVTVFSSYPINPDYIENLREKVIITENLHINESISMQRFDELYENYGGILTQELFAEEILDTSIDNVKNARRRNNDITILTKIEIPEEYIVELRDKVVSENNLKSNDLKSLDYMRVLYKKYGYILSEKQFVTLILGVPPYNYDQLNTGTTKQSYILVDKEEKDFEEIRRKVISENKLHYDDEMEYKEFHRIHQQYGPTIREYIFAEKILDISQVCLGNLRHNKENSSTHILLSEPLPSDEEILILKKEILKKYKLHRRDSINYKQFKKIYNKYAGVMPEDMFAEKILDVQKGSLHKIKYIKNSMTMILLKSFPSKEELKELKQKVRTENEIYPGKAVSLEEFEKCFTKYEHILTKNEFARTIFKIPNTYLKKLTDKEEKTVTVGDVKRYRDNLPSNSVIENIREYLIQGLSISQIAGSMFIPINIAKKYLDYAIQTGAISLEECKIECIKRLFSRKESRVTMQKITNLSEEEINGIVLKIKQEAKNEKNEEKRLFHLRGRISKILDDYLDTPKALSIVNEYIELVMKRYPEGDIPKRELEILKESVIFIQGGVIPIEFVVKACIHHQKYKEAHRFISENIDNEGITKKEKIDLRTLQGHIKEAIKKEEALNMIKNGETDVSKSKKQGLTNAEAIGLRNRFLRDKKDRILED